jgi:hypothetical protein
MMILDAFSKFKFQLVERADVPYNRQEVIGCLGITWTLVGSYNKLSTETSSGAGLPPLLQFIPETPVTHGNLA